MRRLLAVIAAAAVGIPIFLGCAAGMAGVAWILLFGDDPWPWWSSAVIFVPAGIIALAAAVSLYRTIMTWRAPPRAG
jgi:hypothetical protein